MNFLLRIWNAIFGKKQRGASIAPGTISPVTMPTASSNAGPISSGQAAVTIPISTTVAVSSPPKSLTPAAAPSNGIVSIVKLPSGDKIADISRYQGKVNFAMMKAAGYVGVFIKATEGDGIVDPDLRANYLGALDADLDCGFYHFLHIKSSAVAQATNFNNAIRGMHISPQLGCAVDLEWDDGLQEAGEKGAEVALSFLACVRDPLIYTAPGFFYGIQPATLAKFAQYRLWLAQYGVSKPKIPAPWKSFWAWQFASKAHVPGVEGYCDVSVIG